MRRLVGHLFGALHDFGLSPKVVFYLLDHDRRHGGDIHPLEWLECREAGLRSGEYQFENPYQEDGTPVNSSPLSS